MNTNNNDALKRNEYMMEQGSFWELLFKLSLPAVVVILIMIIYNMADTYFIGQTGDPNKISAISICMPALTILSGIGTLFGIGGSTAISISLGEGNSSKIKHITAFCYIGVLLIGILFALLLFFFTRPICLLLGADEATIDYSITYLKVFAFASPFALFSNGFGTLLRSDGEAATSMLASISGTIFNIIGDAVFILLFHWDVFGAALATALGNVLSVFFIILILVKNKPLFIPHFKDLSLKKEYVLPVLTLGLPMTFSTVLSSIAGTIQNRLMIHHGSIYLAAQSVAGKLGMLITMLIMGLCIGIQPAISFNFGSRNYKRMHQVLRQITIFTLMVGVLLAAGIFFFKDKAIAIFIDNKEVIAHGQVFVIASVCVGPIYAIYQICQTFLQATGKATSAILVSLLDKGLVFIPLLFIMNRLLGAYGIAFSHAATMLVSVLVAILLTLKETRKTMV